MGTMFYTAFTFKHWIFDIGTHTGVTGYLPQACSTSSTVFLSTRPLGKLLSVHLLLDTIWCLGNITLENMVIEPDRSQLQTML